MRPEALSPIAHSPLLINNEYWNNYTQGLILAVEQERDTDKAEKLLAEIKRVQRYIKEKSNQ